MYVALTVQQHPPKMSGSKLNLTATLTAMCKIMGGSLRNKMTPARSRRIYNALKPLHEELFQIAVSAAVFKKNSGAMVLLRLKDRALESISESIEAELERELASTGGNNR